MEGKNTQKSILAFEIPIGVYENDMNRESSKGKKNEIHDLLKNHNQLKSEAEFREIEDQMHYACRDGNLELIQILLSEPIQDDSKDFTFKIDKTKHTALLFKVNKNLKDFTVPRTVKHGIEDYLVTSILSLSVRQQISEASNLKKIHQSAQFTGMH